MLYINDFRNKTNLIGNYLKALSAGQTSLTAAITAFGDLKKLENALSVQISSRRLRLPHAAHRHPHR